ncbi:LPS export ABC transporter periplasmic protein LptC [Sodalis-like secondary symbiont of Drepanosiphum platanoidis]|uniref:LPS export ABC transporter periplasmic protein LptC n=1 Tax=Sodalis-like secondary symbiont of Drepanosiphum platanoidis TaxID=2994493 RepID=UPI003463F537
MNKKKLLVIILLLITIFILFFLKKLDNNIFLYKEKNFFYPKYQIFNSKIFYYNKNGFLNYTIISNKIKYFPLFNKIKLYNPLITIFDKNIKYCWKISSNKLKINKNKYIYLYKKVKIINFNNKSKINIIKTQNLLINLYKKNIYFNK